MKAATKKRNAPGRPEGVSGLREAILDSAETVFSQNGYSGTSLRAIAEAAGVTTALISYYFGSKGELHEQVYMAQAVTIAKQRIEGLKALQAQKPVPSTSEIFRAFVEPLQVMRSTEAGRKFQKFQWSVETEPQGLSYRLRKQAYDESTHAYAKALSAARPDWSIETCYARLAIVIGAAIYASSERHRLDELVPGLSARDGADLILRNIIELAGEAQNL